MNHQGNTQEAVLRFVILSLEFEDLAFFVLLLHLLWGKKFNTGESLLGDLTHL